MTTLIKSILVALLWIILFSCQTETKSGAEKLNQALKESKNEEVTPEKDDAQKSLVIYGSHGCSHCLNFKAKLDSAKMDYVFNDIDEDDKNVLALQQLLAKHKHFDRVQLPVVYINDETLLIGPEFTEVYSILNTVN